MILTNVKKDKGKYKKDSFTEKKRKAWNRGKRTQMPVTLTEGVAGTLGLRPLATGELCH